MKSLTKYLKCATGIFSLAFLLMACSSGLNSLDPTLSTSRCEKPVTLGYGGSPTASFVLEQRRSRGNSKNMPLTAHFDASSSYDPDGEIVEYKWRFDDISVVRKTPFVTRKFQNNRSVMVTLTVTDDKGNATSAFARITKGSEIRFCLLPYDPGN